MLDSRTPASQLVEEEVRHTKEVNEKVERLMREARLWRVANSAQWVAWGVVQASVPDMKPDETETETEARDGATSSSTREREGGGEGKGEGAKGHARAADDGQQDGEEHKAVDEAGFDYLGYAQERALFFWGDVLGLGIVDKNDLPPELLAKVKTVNY